MDSQSFVNETFHKLAKQGAASVVRGDSGIPIACQYLNASGYHCAIGFWLRDDVFSDPALNSGGIATVWGHVPDWMKAFGQPVLVEMQAVHDRPHHWFSPQALWEAMQAYARNNNVKLDPSIEAEIWANWKGQPPGNLPEIESTMPLPAPQTVKLSLSNDAHGWTPIHYTSDFKFVDLGGQNEYVTFKG